MIYIEWFLLFSHFWHCLIFNFNGVRTEIKTFCTFVIKFLKMFYVFFHSKSNCFGPLEFHVVNTIVILWMIILGMIRFAGFSFFCIYEDHVLDHKYGKTDCKIQITVKKNSSIVNIFSINRHSLQYRLFTQFFSD